jgi:lipid-binding SYLF domain-containing protein
MPLAGKPGGIPDYFQLCRLKSRGTGCAALGLDDSTSTIHQTSGIKPRSEKDQAMKKTLVLICLSIMLSTSAFAASTRENLQARIDAAKVVLDQIMATPDKSIPIDILERATCVGVIPGLKKGGFIVGGQYGQGVVTCRTGHGWSAPVFIREEGGSYGFQIGVQSVDLVLVAVNDRGFQDLLKSKFKIGAEAAASAGPVGRNSEASTDWKLSAELLTYSRSKGLLAGVNLNGARVNQNAEDTELYFGRPEDFENILKGNVAVPAGAVEFVRTVAHYFVAAKNHQ